MNPLYRRHTFPSLTRLRASVRSDGMPALLDDPPLSVPSPELLEDARQQGLAQGREEGRALGVEEGTARARKFAQDGLAALSQPLEQLIASFRTLQDQHRDALRQEVADLVDQVARQVVRGELEQSPERLLTFVDEALSTLPAPADSIEVRLHPEEYQRIVAAAPEQAARWQLSPDERLAPGECRIKAGMRELDAGCGQRLAACMEQIRAQLSASANEGARG